MWWARRAGSPGGAGQPAILRDGLSRRDRPFSMTDYLDVTAFPAEPWVFRAVILAEPPALPAGVKPHGSSCAKPNRCLLRCSRRPLHRRGLQASSQIPHGSSQLRVCSRMDPPAASIPAGTSRTPGWTWPPTAPWGPSRGVGAPCLCLSVSRWDPTPPEHPRTCPRRVEISMGRVAGKGQALDSSPVALGGHKSARAGVSAPKSPGSSRCWGNIFPYWRQLPAAAALSKPKYGPARDVLHPGVCSHRT